MRRNRLDPLVGSRTSTEKERETERDRERYGGDEKERGIREIKEEKKRSYERRK